MKFSTRARYGLRMMVELARGLQGKKLMHLGEIAEITGISLNYLAQLAMPLKSSGLIIGVSGKKGGYQLGKPASKIKLSEIIQAIQGPIAMTECSKNPNICLYSPFCETHMIWVIASQKLHDVFEQFTLADLIDSKWKEETCKKYADILSLNPNIHMAKGNEKKGCPATDN